jgi:hypothetical protein
MYHREVSRVDVGAVAGIITHLRQGSREVPTVLTLVVDQDVVVVGTSSEFYEGVRLISCFLRAFTLRIDSRLRSGEKAAAVKGPMDSW